MSLVKLFEKIDLQPKNVDLYYQAFTHTSFVNEKKTGTSFQRLEFLGDALIDVEAAVYLFNEFPNLSEGEMTIIRTNVVNAQSLAKHSLDLELPKLLKVGKGAEEVRDNPKMQSDLFESLCAAIYIDLGVEKLRSFLKFNIFKAIDATGGKSQKNPKTILQEMLQADSRENVLYETSATETAFSASVSHSGIKLGVGVGETKKEAEINAALSALSKFESGNNETN